VQKCTLFKGGKMKTVKIILITITVCLLFASCEKNEIINDLTFEEEIVKSESIKTITDTLEEMEYFPKIEENEEIKIIELIDSLSIINDSLQTETQIVSRNYILQLSCVTDKIRLKNEQKDLKKFGYETNISSKKNRNGTMYHRLRLKGFYTKSEAKQLGEKIKKEFLNISDFLVLKVK